MLVRHLANTGLSYGARMLALRLACNAQGLGANKIPAGSWQQFRYLRLYKERTVRAMYWRGRSFDKFQYPERRRQDYQDWNYRSEIYAFSRRLQENLSEDTLRVIFTHPSYVDNLSKKQAQVDMPSFDIKSNAELAQRGHSILEDCIKAYLRYFYERLPEDGVIAITSYLNSEEVMADIAKLIGCREIILSAEWPPNQTTMANTVRAFIAGIESECDLKRARRFIVDFVISYLNDKHIFDDVWNIPHPKETLNLLLQNSQLPPYEPRIMFQTGVKTIESCHVVGLYTNQRFLGSSPGETLQIAEECAALDALLRLFDLKETHRPYVYGEASDQIDYTKHSGKHDYIKSWRFSLDR